MIYYEVNAPHVLGEVIDGEAIIMDLKSGYYYSCLGVGAAVWSCMEARCAVDDIEESLRGRFPDAAAAIAEDLAAFVGQLQEHNLIRPAPEGSKSEGPVSMDNGGPAPALLEAVAGYDKPELTSYTDMQDLLLLDPVHEVDETGWPEAKK